MKTLPSSTIDVDTVRSPGAFLDLARRFYVEDPHYVPPLTFVDKREIDRRRNAFFENAEAEFFAARRAGEIVGRISAVRNFAHDEMHGDRVGFFGHFEASDAEAAHEVLETASRWLSERGATELRGPINLSMNYPCGLLIEGEAGPPVLLMAHNPPEYREYLESFGLEKAKDLVALRVDDDNVDGDRVERLVAWVERRGRFTLRAANFKRFREEVDVLWMLYNEIWESNWGFVPFNRPEFDGFAANLKSICRPELVRIAMDGDRPAGLVVSLADINPAIRACDGRLFPFGWWKFTRTLRSVRMLRVLVLGSRREHRKAGVDALLLGSALREGRKLGFRECEAGWVLEDNHDMLSPLQSMGFRTTRRYRIFRKALTPTPLSPTP